MKSRIGGLLLIYALLSAAFFARIFYIQVIPNKALSNLENNLYTTIVSIPPQRGKILDRNGAELATNIKAPSLFADPKKILEPAKLAKLLTPFLKIPESDIRAKLTAKKRFIWLKRFLDPAVAVEIKSWNVQGLGIVEESKRAYPNLSLLSQSLGFVDPDGIGLAGLEKSYNTILGGDQVQIKSKRDAKGRLLFMDGNVLEVRASGNSLETTIDRDLQYELERVLESATESQRADSAMGVILNPHTGEVLAMGTYPSFDPNFLKYSRPEQLKNRVVSDVFEPGSTFKMVAVATALIDGIAPNKKYFCENGKFKIGKKVIKEADQKHSFGWLTLSQILEVSSNIGTTKVVFDLGAPKFLNMIQNFGFNQKTGIDLVGESSGLLSKGNIGDHLLSNMSFGHGIAVSALQLAVAYGAVANGGNLMKPFLVKRAVSPEGIPVFERKPEVVRRVLTSKQAATLNMMLTGTTEEGGTGTAARVDGYLVAGKTGTAQKVDTLKGGYIPNTYLSSFAGFVPSDNPQFVIFVLVDSPRNNYYGAQVAAPMFNRLASFALRQKGFLPTVIDQKSVLSTRVKRGPQSVRTNSNLDSKDILPDFSGLTVREISEYLEKNKGMTGEFIGHGSAVEQWPQAGTSIQNIKKLKIKFEDGI